MTRLMLWVMRGTPARLHPNGLTGCEAKDAGFLNSLTLGYYRLRYTETQASALRPLATRICCLSIFIYSQPVTAAVSSEYLYTFT